MTQCRLLKSGEVMELLGIHGNYRALQRIIDSGQLEPVKLHGCRGYRKFRKCDVERLIGEPI